MTFALGAALLALVTAISCALPGVFVVLRKNSMLIDAIGHAVFPGIVVGYFFTHDLDSPWLILGAALAGLIVVLGAEYLSATRLISGDAPHGLIFPALFAGGVILVTNNFANIHLDTHAVLVGDLNLASMPHLIVGTRDFGPQYMYVMLLVLAINAGFIFAFYPQLKLSTFDSEIAQTMGMRPRLLNAAFMFLVSVTVTAAFNAAGALLVVALIVVPAATAYLLSKQLSTMFALTIGIAVLGSLGGFWSAYHLGAATSATMSVFYGVIFIVVWLGQRLFHSLRHV
ncbi:metal ABC transporter permease [Corynebacterium renale]|uniref:metal ABC transporter permease n=1 Tax=Corynebacterium renale TaxID=1724 RepID=UPI000DFCCD6F|nr:metal ABC transporter permease [Corynebacterium renale]STC94890.1 ABC transporter [Corynebacterium renale]